MVDNIKPTKLGSPTYVKGKSVATSKSNANTRAVLPVDGMLSEKLEQIIQSVNNDTGEVDDVARVNSIKGQLRQGTYVVNSQQLADDLLQEYPPVLVSADQNDN